MQAKQSSGGRYLKNIVYGGIDGIITTFAVIAGGAGAALSSSILLVLGLANVLADGFSMGFGDMVSSRAENEVHAKDQQRLSYMLDHDLEQASKEIKAHLKVKGLSRTDVETMTRIILKKKPLALQALMERQNGRGGGINDRIVIKSLYTFSSFILFGSIPLLTYVVAMIVPEIRPLSFVINCVLTACTLFMLGAVKTKFTGRNWFLSGLEMLGMGGVSAVIAFVVGNSFSWLIQ